MRRPKRRLAGLLALVAMTFSFAETVAASACAPGMGMAMQAVGAGDGHAGDPMAAGPHDCEHGPSDEGDRECPFGPAVAGCTGVAPLPSRVAGDIVPRLHAETAAFPEPSERGVLLANALFRPPRA